jgi:molybdopterin-guanine dinucleotide biosynthesis protein A
MDAWFAMHRQVDVYFADDMSFANINTVDELNALSAQSAASD